MPPIWDVLLCPEAMKKMLEKKAGPEVRERLGSITGNLEFCRIDYSPQELGSERTKEVSELFVAIRKQGGVEKEEASVLLRERIKKQDLADIGERYDRIGLREEKQLMPRANGPDGQEITQRCRAVAWWKLFDGSSFKALRKFRKSAVEEGEEIEEVWNTRFLPFARRCGAIKMLDRHMADGENAQGLKRFCRYLAGSRERSDPLYIQFITGCKEGGPAEVEDKVQLIKESLTSCQWQHPVAYGIGIVNQKDPYEKLTHDNAVVFDGLHHLNFGSRLGLLSDGEEKGQVWRRSSFYVKKAEESDMKLIRDAWDHSERVEGEIVPSQL
jgi:hypothetical protein